MSRKVGIRPGSKASSNYNNNDNVNSAKLSDNNINSEVDKDKEYL